MREIEREREMSHIERVRVTLKGYSQEAPTTALTGLFMSRIGFPCC